MRINLPVTQHEYLPSPDDTLLSTTDTKGRISYANGVFVRTCGFERDELMGKAHSIVRHPDMPEEAFADLWRTIKDGHPWTALVKNRRKNGDHYWVRANAAPMRRRGQLTGYISVRTVPGRAEVTATAPLYARFRDGRARGLAFHRGLVIRTGLLAWMSALQLLPTVWRVRLPLMLAALGGGAALWGLEGGASHRFWGLGSVWLALLAACDAFIEWQVTAPLRAVQALSQAVASGEPGVPLQLNRCDDIGLIACGIQQAGLNLCSLVADVREQTEALESVGADVAAASLDLSGRTAQAASSLEETAAAMEEQTATIQRNADAAQQATAEAMQASQKAAQGGVAVETVVETMAKIAQASRQVADFIAIIDGIAFQTNILALNAAVEAARAGDQGRGFAVVANEVRTLASRAAASAKEVKSLIQTSEEMVTHGESHVQRAGRTIAEVVEEARRTSALIAEIANSTREQTIGIEQVGQAVAHLDAVTQQNAAMVEEGSATAATLRERAHLLLGAVKVFS